MSKFSQKSGKNPLTGLELELQLESFTVSGKGEQLSIVAKEVELDLLGNPYKSEAGSTYSILPSGQIHSMSAPAMGAGSVANVPSSGLTEEEVASNKAVLDELRESLLKVTEKAFGKLKFKKD